MVTKYTDRTLTNVYKDDYDPAKGFHKILFNNKRSLQARELTQLQTIIQKGIERFGKNIFKEGAAVSPGGFVLNKNYSFIKLDTSVNSFPFNPTTLVGKSFAGQTSGVVVKVIEAIASEGSDPATLYVQYTSTLNGVSGASPVRVTPGETLLEVDGSVTLSVQTVNTTQNPAYGYGTRLSVGASEFFVSGYFVYVPEQSIILSKYSGSIDGIVGFKVLKEVVSVNDDVSLYDNQGSNPNYTAPGADRFRIRLSLTRKEDLAADETFVYYARIYQSRIIDEVTGFDQYNKINDLLAVRTKEESGDYTVIPFRANYLPDTNDSSKLKVRVGTGKAYVNGYRISKNVPTFLSVDKPTTTSTVTNEPVSADYGNYIILSSLKGIPKIDTLTTVDIRDNANFSSGNKVGVAKIRAVEKYLNGFKAYIFDISMESGKVFQVDAKSIGSASPTPLLEGTIQLVNTRAVIYDAQNQDLFFPLPKERAQAISDISLTIQKRYEASLSSNSVSLTAGSGETFSNPSDWIFTLADGTAVTDTSTLTFTGIGTSSAQVSGAALAGSDGDTIQILAYSFKSTASVATKTLTETGGVFAYNPSTGTVDLGKRDIQEVTSIRYVSSSGDDASQIFTLDNGQRETHYENGKLILKPGRTITSNSFYVVFNYFEHGSGDFFAVNSYSGLDYADIPSFTLRNGSEISLRDVLDFRPSKGADGTFSAADGVVRPLPKNTSTIAFDVDYYLPRYDKLVLNENGYFQILQGNPSFNPRFPTTPENMMELYRVKMNPNTLDETDLTIKQIENKRYTMRDIGKIEKRIDNLEEVTSLSLLELDTKNIDVLDEDGRNRTKAGFFVDNFLDQYYTDVNSPEYKASLDPKARIVRPGYISRNVGLLYDSALSTNTVLKGDNVYLNYTSQLFIEQEVATSTISVNPYILLSYEGHVKLSPSSDEWKETEYTAQNLIENKTVLDTNQAVLWNEWEWNWSGADINGLEVGDALTQTQEISTRKFSERSGNWITRGTESTTQTVTNRVISSETIKEVVGDRVVDIALIPFMRSRLVYFKAEGLQPNTEVFPFFDGVLVSDWCRQEPYVGVNTNKATEWGNTQLNGTEHPNGSTKLYTNSRGTVEGSFFVPSNNTLRFRTGTVEFKLLDISVDNEDNATSVARAVYGSTGSLYTRTEDIITTRVLEISGSERIDTNRINTRRIWAGDPLAQSFEVKEPDGVFITKVSLFFSAKAQTLPVWVQIRPMVNGYPSATDIIPGAFKLLNPSSVNISDDASVATDFVFDEPVYLNSYNEYAIVVLSNDPDYLVYKSKVGELELGSTEVRFGRQSFLGSLFKGQTGTTWSASQDEDLKFQIHRANFTSTSGTVVLKNSELPYKILGTDPIELFTDSDTDVVKVEHKGHGFAIGDTVKVSGVDSSTDYGEFLNGEFTITAVDPSGYTFSGSSITTPSPVEPIRVGGITTRVNENYQFNTIFPTVEALQPSNTGVSFTGQFHSGKSFAGTETPYVRDASATDIPIKQNVYFDTPKLIANPIKEATLANPSAVITANLTTSNSQVSPVVDLQRASIITVENIIDNPASSDTSINNVPIAYVDETESTDGSASAKHITTVVKLLNNARGLRILLGANRPSICGIDMYYRTSNDSTPLNEVSWTYIDPDNAVPSDDNPNVFREYRYTPGGEQGTLDDFNSFQLKIVFTSTNSSKVPVLRDLRVIALGD